MGMLSGGGVVVRVLGQAAADATRAASTAMACGGAGKAEQGGIHPHR